jgi:hypothetical protein
MSEHEHVAEVDRAPEALASEGRAGGEPIPARSRRFAPLALTLAILAVVGVVGAVLWTNSTHTPEYSLGQMASAAWNAVQKYVDVDAVTSGFVDAAISTAFGAGASGTGMSRTGSAIGQTGMKSAAAQQFRDSLKQSVANAASTNAGGLSGFLFVKQPKRVTYPSKDEALVTVEVPTGRGGAQDVALKMNRVADHWRITAFANTADLLGLPY